MQRLWSAEELGEGWTLGAEDLTLLSGLPAAGKLGIAAQLAFWRQSGRFPDDEADLAPAVVGHLAAQVGVHADALEGYEWTGRTGRRHRRLVLDHLAVAGFDDAAEARLRNWLSNELLPREPAPSWAPRPIRAKTYASVLHAILRVRLWRIGTRAIMR
jgi:hypothetical protein